MQFFSFDLVFSCVKGHRGLTACAYFFVVLSYRFTSLQVKGKGKVFPYSLPSVGPGADPGVQERIRGAVRLCAI